MTFTMVGSWIVGAVFLGTGIVKALASEEFIRQVFRYRLLSPLLVPFVAIAFIGLECAWGLGLILNEFPNYLIPGSIVLIFGLSILTIWSTSTGRTEDCGCYGGLLVITPTQSVLLNLGYIALLVLTWYGESGENNTEPWKWILAVIVLVIGVVLGWQSRSKPLVDFSRLKVGNRWRPGWLEDVTLEQGSHFLVFISKDCPYCKQWVPLMNIMNVQSDFPNVLGVMSLKEEDLVEFKEQHLVRFPLKSMSKLLWGYMAKAYPTAVLVENGVIAQQWVGEIPQEFLGRIKQFYQAVSVGETTKRARFSG